MDIVGPPVYVRCKRTQRETEVNSSRLSAHPFACKIEPLTEKVVVFRSGFYAGLNPLLISHGMSSWMSVGNKNHPQPHAYTHRAPSTGRDMDLTCLSHMSIMMIGDMRDFCCRPLLLNSVFLVAISDLEDYSPVSLKLLVYKTWTNFSNHDSWCGKSEPKNVDVRLATSTIN